MTYSGIGRHVPLQVLPNEVLCVAHVGDQRFTNVFVVGNYEFLAAKHFAKADPRSGERSEHDFGVAALKGLVSSEKLKEIGLVGMGDPVQLGRYVRVIDRDKEPGDCGTE